jgi:hypothetical protein
LRLRLRLPCVLTLKNKTSFQGLLWETDGRVVVLRNAELLTPSGATVVDGELVVFESDVDTLQFV